MEYDAFMEGLDANDEKYRYFMAVDPTMRDILGPIETVDDPLTGRAMRRRTAKIGMVRNPKPESMRDVMVYLDPLPHIRIDNPKDLQGWYQAKHNEKPGSRIRPCMTDSILTEPYGGFCTVGCAFSLLPEEMIDTPTGPRPIALLRTGDFVWGRTQQGTVLSRVRAFTKHWKPEGYVILRLNDDRELRLTADHPIYSADRAAWVATGELKTGERLEQIQFGRDGQASPHRSRSQAQGWAFAGSEGLSGAQGHAQGGSGPVNGLPGFGAQSEEASAARGPTIASITAVVGGLYVYDIETETGNFYHHGILVHNCYINSGHRGYRGSGIITVPINYGAHVRKQLKSMQVSTAGYHSSFTDPFLPLEGYYHNTQNSAQAFIDEGLPVYFLSRLRYPDWAVAMLKKNKYNYAQKSINTPDPDDWKKLSPGALPLEDHFEDIRRLHEEGIYVSIQVNPIIAGIVTHEDIEQLFEKLAEVGTDHVIVKFVEANHPWAPAMVQRITDRFGDNRAAYFKELFTENSCGGQKTVVESYRREAHARYLKKATELGMTYSLCYEYTRRPDGSWASMGPEFHTADTCHGHRVPIHVRMGPTAGFKPLAACPPSGCLSCADDAPSGKVPCGSETLGAAKALRLPDMRKPFDGIKPPLVEA